MRGKKDYRNEDNPAHLRHQLFLLSSSLTDGLWDAELLIRHGIPWEGVRAFPPQKTPLASPGGVEKTKNPRIKTSLESATDMQIYTVCKYERYPHNTRIRKYSVYVSEGHQISSGKGRNALTSPSRRWLSGAPFEWSYVSTPSSEPLLGLSIGQVVDRAERRFGDREAVVSVHQAVRRTFSQVKEESDLVAAGFLAAGLEPGDRLGIWGPNSYEWYLTQFAAAKAGLILVRKRKRAEESSLVVAQNLNYVNRDKVKSTYTIKGTKGSSQDDMPLFEHNESINEMKDCRTEKKLMKILCCDVPHPHDLTHLMTLIHRNPQVNINPAYRPSELEYCLNKVGVKGIVCDEEFKTSDYYKMLCALAPELPSSVPGDLSSATLPHLKKVFFRSQEKLSGTFRFADLYEAGESSHRKKVDELSSKIQFDSACNIQYTSGTTGLPKAAVLSHHQIVNNAYHNIGKRIGYGEKPHRICLSVPLYHCFGCVAGTVCGMLYGATCVMPSAGFDPDAIVRTLGSEKFVEFWCSLITSCYGTPTMFVDILNAYRKNPTDLSAISTGIMAGAPCPQELVMAVMNELKMKDFCDVRDDRDESRDLPVLSLRSSRGQVIHHRLPGRPHREMNRSADSPSPRQVKVVDESGAIVRAGEAGELLVRGYCNFLGYWDDPGKTREIVTEDRWLRTGDLVLIQPDGYGRFLGRIKDMVIRGGENIYPAEVENFFMGHPDVIEAQVFGVPDARMGEEVATWIRKAEDSSLSDAELREWCKGKIAHYKVPRYVLFKDEFPRTVTGKIQKFKMRELTIEELNLKT
nr:acyl-CoA synthetase family member 2, mitochondrial-like [Penaeus vannamei]